MNLNDLTPSVTASKVADQIKIQFGADYKIPGLNLTESIKLLNKTNNMVVEFKLNENLHSSENNASYMKLLMVNEAAFKRASELTETSQIKGSDMSKTYVTALKIAALGGKLSEAQIKSLQVSPGMQAILENQRTAQKFMRKIIESKKSRKALNESEIADAQTTLAAQDIADQIQSMIEKFADIQYKELPALHDSIRNSQGVEAAEEFNSSLLGSLGELTSSLESTKGDVNNAIAVLTGQEVAMGDDDLDLDAMDAGDDMDMDAELDLDMDMDGDAGEFDLDLEVDGDEDVDLGRERR